MLCRTCIVKIEYIVLAFFLSEGVVSKGVLPVYGKRGDKTQIWRHLDVGVRECLVEVIFRDN